MGELKSNTIFAQISYLLKLKKKKPKNQRQKQIDFQPQNRSWNLGLRIVSLKDINVSFYSPFDIRALGL